MNLKEGARCVVNHDENLTVIDFDGDVSLAEKLVRHEASTTKWMITQIARPYRATTDRGEESAPTIESWSGAVDNVAEVLVVSKRLLFDSVGELTSAVSQLTGFNVTPNDVPHDGLTV
ncbi:hypothetical protein GW17_00025664 [Ensete ventricosum]|nr:hypothetical protein GW17_00025664 [Ensete ventricosum]